MSGKISELLSQTEVLAQMAEEASELAQAALKLRRVLDGTNPTPVNKNEATDNLLEELADVQNCFHAFLEWCPEEYHKYIIKYINDMEDEKRKRWIERLRGRTNA